MQVDTTKLAYSRDTAVVILAYNRPNYFRQTVQSLVACKDIAAYPIYVFLDRSPIQDRMVKILKKYGPKHCHVIRRSTNVGCGINAIAARHQVFEKEGHSRCIVLEDDVAISPYFFEFMQQLYEWSRQFVDVGAVQAWSPCQWSVPAKRKALNQVIEVKTHLQGYMIDRRTWGSINDLLCRYRQRFLEGRAYAKRDHATIRAWMKKQVSDGPRFKAGKYFPADPRYSEYRRYYQNHPATGQDAVTNLAMWQAGLRRIGPVVNRMINTGKEGIHMKEAEWIAMGFRDTKLDVFARDEKPMDFQAVDFHKIRSLKAK